MKKLTVIAAVVALVALMATSAVAGYSYSSTNEQNKTGTNPLHPGVVGPHAYDIAVEDGQVTLGLVNPFADFACFEYRIDGDTTDFNNATHPNPDIDGPYYRNHCVYNGTYEAVFAASEKVEVRLAYGSHADWYFDWTTFPQGAGEPAPTDPEPEEPERDVDNPSGPEARAECMRGGWDDFGFRNQGQCVRYVNTGMDSR